MTTTRAVWVKHDSPDHEAECKELRLMLKREDIQEAAYYNPLRGIIFGCIFGGAIWAVIILGWVMWRLYRG